MEYSATKKLLAFGDSVNARLCLMYEGCTDMGDNDNLRVEKEVRIMEGLTAYLLPKVGHCVDTLDLAYGISVTGEMVSVIIIVVNFMYHRSIKC